MIQTQVLTYGHERDEEIQFLNRIVKRYGDYHSPEFKPLIDELIARIDHLTTAQHAKLELYDQRVHR